MRALAIGDGHFSFSSAIVRVVISSWVDNDSDNHDNDNEDNCDAKNVAASSSDSTGEGREGGGVRVLNLRTSVVFDVKVIYHL